MLKKIAFIAISLTFALVGLVFMLSLSDKIIYLSQSKPAFIACLIVVTLGAGSIGAFITPAIIRGVEKLTEKLAHELAKISAVDIVGSVLGLIAGLFIASLLGIAFRELAYVGPYLSIIFSLVFGYIGLVIGYKKRIDFRNMTVKRQDKTEKPKGFDKLVSPKVLDTSVIIDGRIADIYRTGFIEGELVIGNFVLEELRHIADSSDPLKRTRGRRGLDIMNQIREDFAGSVVISDRDYPDIPEVDSKLLKLAQELNGVVLTNDFNLNKVAQLQQVKVLNINELSNAVKPVLIPGEELTVQVIKEGNVPGQGVAYLDDGTMIVIENGKRFIGKTIQVVVTSVLQTSAGRMIFARYKAVRNSDGSKNTEVSAIGK